MQLSELLVDLDEGLLADVPRRFFVGKVLKRQVVDEVIPLGTQLVKRLGVAALGLDNELPDVLHGFCFIQRNHLKDGWMDRKVLYWWILYDYFFKASRSFSSLSYPMARLIIP